MNGYLLSLFYTLRRALSWEIKRKRLDLTIGDQVHELITDKEGYFEYLVEEDCFDAEGIEVSLSTTISKKIHRSKVELKSYVQDVPLGIISDIDDTILISKVKSFLMFKMILYTLFLNPFKRKPMQSAAAFYHQKLIHLKGYGPIVYISNSPWNMYHYLSVFLEYNDFPKGELQLRDFGRQMLKKKKPLHLQNKYLEIEKILSVFSETKFVLVGDTAEKDFDIYTSIKDKYGDQISEVIMIKADNVKNEERINGVIEERGLEYVRMAESFEELLEDEEIADDRSQTTDH